MIYQDFPQYLTIFMIFVHLNVSYISPTMVGDKCNIYILEGIEYFHFSYVCFHSYYVVLQSLGQFHCDGRTL